MKSLIDFFFIIAIPILTIYMLWMGSDFFIPLLIAIVIWYLIISIASAVHNIPIGKRRLPNGLSIIIAIGICGIVFYLFFSFLTKNIAYIIHVLPSYQDRLNVITDHIFTSLGIEEAPEVGKIIGKDRIVSFASSMAQTLTSLAGNMGIIFIYVLFLLLERESFDRKLAAAIKDKAKLMDTEEVIKKISSQIQKYIRVKTLLSVITAVCSYMVMKVIGVDFAGFWAQLIFFLNYIPTIGSIIATILPCLLTILQFESWYPFFIVTAILISIQFFIGNVLEPRLIGKIVNLSGLVIIISLIVWGKIWGITGMILCVPIMVILNIVFTKFEKTRWIAVMLSSNGEIDQG